MITLRDIKNVAFTRKMGGYRAEEVDVFIDNCIKSFESLSKEKEDLEKKLEILADKLVDYRNDEDSIRSALLSAQRLGDATVRESNHKSGMILEDAQKKSEKIMSESEEKAEKLVYDAEEKVRRIHAETVGAINAQQNELESVKKQVSDFKARIIMLYDEQLSIISKLPEVVTATSKDDSDTDSEDETDFDDEETNVVKIDIPDPIVIMKEEISETESEDDIDDSDVIVSSDEKLFAKSIVFEDGVAVSSEDEIVDVEIGGSEKVVETDDEDDTDTDSDEEKGRYHNLKFGEDYDLADDKDDNDDEEKKSRFFRKNR